jgi:transcriptional regulator with PAS, ATPase and Fis domain
VAVVIVQAVLDLRNAKHEREERLTLWPQDDLQSDDDDAVVLGRMREVMSFARKVAKTNVTVLITGESGTGKELVAREIHRSSERANKPFIPLNCTAVPAELLESHLFGHKRGAFTGADRDYPGLVRSARGGTLFLDEIGELGLELQPKFLRFLESGEISPLGEPMPLSVDVRIVAATNASLEDLVQARHFREDLFYRLNVVRIRIPPLRERRDEIPSLVRFFVGKAAREFGKGTLRVDDEVMALLSLYSWPGNIRQLQNEIRRMVALAEPDRILTIDAMSQDVRDGATQMKINGEKLAVKLHDTLDSTVSTVEREMIKAALTTHRGVEAAARALGISRKGLYLKRQRLGL